jgi:hypothetical protein
VKTCTRGFASEFTTFFIKNRETPFMSWDFLGERMFVASIISPGVTLTPARLKRGISSFAGEFLKKFSAKLGTLFWSMGLICSTILEGMLVKNSLKLLAIVRGSLVVEPLIKSPDI